jgi:hypothetical protein
VQYRVVCLVGNALVGRVGLEIRDRIGDCWIKEGYRGEGLGIEYYGLEYGV